MTKFTSFIYHFLHDFMRSDFSVTIFISDGESTSQPSCHFSKLFSLMYLVVLVFVRRTTFASRPHRETVYPRTASGSLLIHSFITHEVLHF
jgi:hypothetical protein